MHTISFIYRIDKTNQTYFGKYLTENISDNHDQSVLVASRENILFKTGWTPKDDLSAGFDWVLKGY